MIRMEWPIELNGEELMAYVSGTYYKGHAGDYYNPPEPAQVEDVEVLLNGKDISETLSAKEMENIEEAYLMYRQEDERCQNERDEDDWIIEE